MWSVMLSCTIEKHKSGRRSFRSPNWFVLFDLQISQVVFIPQAQPHAQSLFLFPIVFGINDIMCKGPIFDTHAPLSPLWQPRAHARQHRAGTVLSTQRREISAFSRLTQASTSVHVPCDSSKVACIMFFLENHGTSSFQLRLTLLL